VEAEALEAAKQRAVAAEDYGEAAGLKARIDALAAP
jgi:hypothetical protein